MEVLPRAVAFLLLRNASFARLVFTTPPRASARIALTAVSLVGSKKMVTPPLHWGRCLLGGGPLGFGVVLNLGCLGYLLGAWKNPA